jgi:tetratricopeptide (TPR) repeat protein
MDTQLETSQKAWKLREAGKPFEAMAIWQQLYYSYLEEQNWERAISTLIDIAICWKIKGEISGKRVFLEAALATLKNIKHIAKREHIDLRNDYDYHLAGIETALGSYEKAIASYEHYLSTSKTPEEEANILAHVGFAKAQHGQKEEGIEILRKSIEMFSESQKENNFQGKDVFRIWKLGAKLRLAQLLDDEKEARELLEDVLKEAKEKNLGARRKQAETLLKNLN